MNSLNQVFFALLYAFIGIMAVRCIYISFFTKPIAPQEYMKKANYAVSLFKARRYANRVLLEALSLENLTEEEKAFIHFQRGFNHYMMRNNAEAVKDFEAAWPFLKKSRIPFNKAYASIVVAYYNVGKKDKAREIYHYLLQKSGYDSRFTSLQYLETRIFK